MLQAILGALATVATAIGALKSAGINIGPIGNEVLKVIDATVADKANFENGQAVVIGNFSESGKHGVLVAVAVDGPAYKSLFGG